ncbi:MAG: carboxypeptidase-like regulatory domain-containing protein [Terracidiphilus sp.]
MLLILAGLLSAPAAMAQNQAGSPNIGVIYGTATAQDGLTAKGLILNAEPLGHPLAMALPWTKTNDTGAFRFEHLPLGRYTVFAEDKDQGYSSFSTGAGGSDPPEVELTTDHAEAEFNLRLPPKAGFLFFNLTNQATGTLVSGVEVNVMLAKKPPKAIFGEGTSSSQAILVPSDQNLLLHVTSWGFREWYKSVGDGIPIRIAPGDRLTLDVQIEPANPLTARIPSADPKKYQGIHDGKDWRNPYLIVRADGIEIAGTAREGSPIPVESVAAALEGLPDSAWPYGLVVAVRENGVGASEAERSRIEANQVSLEPLLSELGVVVGFRPSE